jgi:hypothetical protein
VICKYVVASMVACQDVCEVVRVRGDAVQPESSLMRDVADIVGWRWAYWKPISDCCVCIVIVMLKGCPGFVIASCVAVSWLDGCRCIWWVSC